MNQTLISVAFSHQLGITPSAFLRKRRLELAMDYLRLGKETIAEISAKCGFGSVETFYRVFKSGYGTSPAKLRREIKK